MKVMTDVDTPKLSRYLAAGAPQACFLPSCRKGFEHSCFRGADSHFYCTQECAAQGAKLDMSHVEELRKPSANPSARRKLFGS